MKNKNTVTTADVAQRAGLSKMTVSRVLNNHPYVSDETRKRVMEAVKELGFTPNTLAKRFFTGKTQLIATIMPVEFMFTSSYFKDLFLGVLQGLEEHNYDLLLHDSRSKRIGPFEKALDLVKGRLVDGLLLVAPMSHDDYVFKLSEEGIPLVVMGECVHRDEVRRVGVDNIQGSSDAVSRLTALGHRHIAMLTFDADHKEAQQRVQGYRQALAAADVPVNEDLIATAYYQRHEAYEETRRLMTEHPEVTAIFAGNLEMTMGAYDGLKSLGKEIPDEVSLISFDDGQDLEMADPHISAVRQNPYQVGLTGAHMLMDIVASKTPVESEQRVIETSFIERGSVAPPPN